MFAAGIVTAPLFAVPGLHSLAGSKASVKLWLKQTPALLDSTQRMPWQRSTQTRAPALTCDGFVGKRHGYQRAEFESPAAPASGPCGAWCGLRSVAPRRASMVYRLSLRNCRLIVHASLAPSRPAFYERTLHENLPHRRHPRRRHWQGSGARGPGRAAGAGGLAGEFQL
jgi:hypothetical protein